MCFEKAFHLILMHFISNIQYFKEFLFKNRFIIFQKFYFSKISIDPAYFLINRNCAQKLLWVSVCFDQSKLIFDQSKIVCQVFKKSDLTYSNHFFKLLFLSPIRTSTILNFLSFLTKYFARFSSPKAGMSIIPFLFHLFPVFHALKGYFRT